MTTATLRVERGEKAPYDLDLGAEDFDIGRGPGNALHFRDPWLSRSHARISWLRERHYLEDLASRNGTYLNGSRLETRRALVHGDSIVLGDIELRYLESSSPPPPPPAGGSIFAGDSTVLLSTDELVFERYREAAPPGDAAAEESLLPSLNAAAASLISHYPLGELVERILTVAVDAVTAERGALLLKPRAASRTLPYVARSAAPRGAARELEVKAFQGFATDDEVRISQTIIGRALDRKQAILTLDAQTDERFDEAVSLQFEGVRSLICVPLWNNREVTGLIYLDQRMAGRTFSARDLRLVGLIANMAAVKIENAYLLEDQLEKRRMEEQLAVGSKIQRQLLPAHSPRLAGYEIRGATRPCYEVGGDYYDFIPLGDGKLAVVIADVAGKGVGAALLMAALQASLRALVLASSEPATLVSQVNQALLQSSPDNRFATLFYGEVDAERHLLEYVSGGHNPGLLLAAGEVEELKPTGPIVGLVEEATYTSRQVDLAPGSTLLLYTDGITELMAPDREEFGVERLLELLRRHGRGSAKKLLLAIGDRMTAFGAGERFDDDSTAVIVRRLP